ncbi:hypothetical protein [Methanococcoides sp. LMO-2]|uniref:Uncharacterized protein n=1 Tax=Methanococcoides cohabitans TaxID=3136559 RepID=A0ABU9KQG8_9EURY
MKNPETHNYSYDLKENLFYAGERRIPAYELEENEIGTCGDCGSTITSLSYHELDDEFVIAGKCVNCGALSANIYDNDWNWVREVAISHFSIPIPADTSDNIDITIPDAREQKNKEVQVSNEVDDLEMLNSIPMKQIETIFSPTEIKAMFARAKGEKCTRQYLYNARKKYQAFEDVFGIKLTI